ncbi:MAG: hypothetical protein EOR16_30045 [Mesorhizobium sp.]|uniref:hypothetical protein n=1 Tax=Mesorhizobium sp. TaxID=1871066 RepID=UPI000FE59798|nr:hypothetical protein [Mesorhizobium sp.]RWI50512.1 MAG: hypothetical protein EOR16_30045 [Mesorhizobium sp.]
MRTAVGDANQIGNLPSTTLVAYEAHIDRIFDVRDAEALPDWDIDAYSIADITWRDQMKTAGRPEHKALPAGLSRTPRSDSFLSDGVCV